MVSLARLCLLFSSLLLLSFALGQGLKDYLRLTSSSSASLTRSDLEGLLGAATVKQCQIPGSGCSAAAGTCTVGGAGNLCVVTNPPQNPVVGQGYGSCTVCTNKSDEKCVNLAGDANECTKEVPIGCPGTKYDCVYQGGGTYKLQYGGSGCPGTWDECI